MLDNPDPSSDSESNVRWSFVDPQHAAGVALLIHGLNNRAEIMSGIGESLRAEGFHLLFLSLRGHRGEGWERLDYAKAWTADVQSALETIEHRYPSLPIIVAGYSLGGVLAALASHRKSVQALLLFAPAIRLNSHRSLLRLLAPLRHIGVALPSMSPREWRANASTSLRAYEGLNDLIAMLSQYEFRIPTAVFLDPNDTLVSFQRMCEWLSESGLDRGCIHTLTGITDSPHLVVVPAARGEQSWRQVEKIIGELLQRNGLKT